MALATDKIVDNAKVVKTESRPIKANLREFDRDLFSESLRKVSREIYRQFHLKAERKRYLAKMVEHIWGVVGSDANKMIAIFKECQERVDEFNAKTNQVEIVYYLSPGMVCNRFGVDPLNILDDERFGGQYGSAFPEGATPASATNFFVKRVLREFTDAVSGVASLRPADYQMEYIDPRNGELVKRNFSPKNKEDRDSLVANIGEYYGFSVVPAKIKEEENRKKVEFMQSLSSFM